MDIKGFFLALTELPSLLALKKGLVPRPNTDHDCIGAAAERIAEQFGDRTAIVFEGSEATWSELNAWSNRYAEFLVGAGLEAGDTVSIMMENPDRIAGRQSSPPTSSASPPELVNNNLRERSLVHCVTVTESKKCIFGGEVEDAIDQVRPDLHLADGADYFRSSRTRRSGTRLGRGHGGRQR